MFNLGYISEGWNQIHKWGEDFYDNHLNPKPLTGYTDNNAENWLYHSESWDQKDFDIFTLLYSFPISRWYIDYLYDKRSQQEYMDNHEIDRVHDPRKLPGTKSTANLVSGSLNFVSSNVSRLYRD